MGKIIGKVIATEKNPSTIDDFYFWTKRYCSHPIQKPSFLCKT